MIKIENTKIASHKTAKSPQFVAKMRVSAPGRAAGDRAATHTQHDAASQALWVESRRRC
jgi:hypothetical protein